MGEYSPLKRCRKGVLLSPVNESIVTNVVISGNRKT